MCEFSEDFLETRVAAKALQIIFGHQSACQCGWLDLSNSESPEFIGRVIAALARDPALLDRSGKVAIAAEAAAELGVRDIDGRQPAPVTLDTA
jgi:hypothetical protein